MKNVTIFQFETGKFKGEYSCLGCVWTFKTKVECQAYIDRLIAGNLITVSKRGGILYYTTTNAFRGLYA